MAVFHNKIITVFFSKIKRGNRNNISDVGNGDICDITELNLWFLISESDEMHNVFKCWITYHCQS